MMNLIVSKEETNDIKKALSHIQNLTHYANHWDKGYYVHAGFSKEQQDACKILNKYNIHQLVRRDANHTTNLRTVELHLKRAEPTTELIEVALINRWDYNELEKQLEFVKQKFKSQIEKQEKELEQAMRGLKFKRLTDFV